MNKLIIISAGAKEKVAIGGKPPYPVIETADIAGVIGTIARENPGLLGLVFFILADEMEQTQSSLQHADGPDFFFSMCLVGQDLDAKRLNHENIRYIQHVSSAGYTQAEFLFHVLKAGACLDEQCIASREKKENLELMLDMKTDQEDLISIGRALSIEKDPDKLFRMILMLSKKITGADAGSIFIVEQGEKGKKFLRFKYSHTFSKELPYEEFVLDLNTKSIAGYVAVTGKVLNIPDVYLLSKGDPVAFNSSFDKTHNYRSRSMLVVPMKNHIDEIIGVIQLINSKEDPAGNNRSTGNEAFEIVLSTPEDFEHKVVPFEKRYETLMEAVAGQAAIAIENNRMIKQIQNQFEEFVKASVTAIESRDIATSGHSFRVAEICKEMAYAINDENDGFFRDISFSDTAIKELEFAALLHDFGKVYIDLAIFQKSKKLFPRDFDNLMLKIDYLYRCTEMRFSIKEKQLLESSLNGADISASLGGLQKDRNSTLERIRDIKERLAQLNEPTVTDNDPEKTIQEIIEKVADTECFDLEGRKLPVLTEDEKINLQIKRGSLNPHEREEIESHVVHTYNFVSRIPWPPEYKNIPEIALKHHEKLDGSGYPSRLKGEDDIPLQARMMALADIYDALAATDRPYKKAVPLSKTLEILKDEARHQKLDTNLVDLFINRRIYEKIDKDSFKMIQVKT